jgi:hypothetical protein
LHAEVTDPAGDASTSLVDSPPRWADLLAGVITRQAGADELRIRLGGDRAPTSSGDDDHTMNLAMYADVDGDGRIDYEVWANLDNGGWGGAWYDDVHQTARFGKDSGIAVSVEGDQVVLRFDADHLGAVDRFRWSLSLEWARYSTLGSPAAVRDSAPANGAPASFPT